MRDLTYKFYTVRTSAILTTSYVASNVNLGSDFKDINQLNQLVLLVDFTKGSLTTAEIKLEFSPDGTNWYQEVAESVSTGTSTVTAVERQFSTTGKYRIPVPVKDRFIRLSAKGTGTVTSSSLGINAVVGVS